MILATSERRVTHAKTYFYHKLLDELATVEAQIDPMGAQNTETAKGRQSVR